MRSGPIQRRNCMLEKKLIWIFNIHAWGKKTTPINYVEPFATNNFDRSKIACMGNVSSEFLDRGSGQVSVSDDTMNSKCLERWKRNKYVRFSISSDKNHPWCWHNVIISFSNLSIAPGKIQQWKVNSRHLSDRLDDAPSLRRGAAVGAAVESTLNSHTDIKTQQYYHEIIRLP